MSDITARRVLCDENLKEPGDFKWSGDRMMFVCPCGCGHIAGIAVSGPKPWAWNGDREKPTCTPSIQVYPHGECKGWHGYLTDGVFKSC